MRELRIALHLYDAVNRGATNILVQTVDSDITTILVGLFYSTRSSINIWVDFGTGRILALTASAKHWGVEKSKALPFFHVFTGCDTTS